MDEQIAALVAIGYSLAEATATVRAALAMVPEGADFATWVPSAELLDGAISDADVVTARNEWYASAPGEFVRILDAIEV